MKEALSEARKAYALGEVPIGSVLVKDGTVLSRGFNLRETQHDPTAHAEIVALRKAAEKIGSWRLSGTTLYVTVEPCVMCAGALVQARVQTLVYGAYDPKGGAVDSLLDVVRFPFFNHRLEVVSGVLEEECRELMQRFFSDLRKS